MKLTYRDTSTTSYEVVANNEAHAITKASRRVHASRFHTGSELQSIEILSKRVVSETKKYKAYVENSHGDNVTWKIEAMNEKEANELVYQKLPSWIYYDTTTAYRIDEIKI